MSATQQSAPAARGDEGRLAGQGAPSGSSTAGQDHFLPIKSIRPTPENWEIYTRPEADDQMVSLVDSVRKHGILDPIIVSADRWILSGHRRHAAAQAAGLRFVPIRIEHDIFMTGASREERIRELIRHNQGSRVKTEAEAIAESVADMDSEEALRIVQGRKAKVHDKAETFGEQVTAGTGRSRRTNPLKQRQEFYQAVVDILVSLRSRKFLPTSERHIHYQLLEKGPMTSKGKKGHPYGTDKGDASKLSDLITDARSAGLIRDSWIIDTTRPSYLISTKATVGEYITKEIEGLFMDYFANVHRDQPCHVELLVEKNTIFPLLRDHVARELRIPITSMRGFGSYPVSCAIRDRFKASGKDRLVIVYASDLDPEGVCMPESFAKYFKEDHGIEPQVIRAAVTMDQVREYNLPPDIEAKPTSSRYKGYVERYGDQCWELDALDPELLIRLVGDACRSCLDVDLLNAALEREQETDIMLAKLNRAVKQIIPGIAKSIMGEGAV